jgi:ubiquinone/menaquinone biosynthesis C-methylase UbiE
MYQSFSERPGSSNSEEKWKAMALSKFDGMRVLDLGCNEGFFVAKALEHGAAEAVGVDLDAKMIASAKERVPNGVFYNESWNAFLARQEPQTVDVVFLLSAMHYADDPVVLLRAIRKVLKPDGLFVLEASVAKGGEPFMTGITRGKPPFTDTVFHPTGAKLSRLLQSEFAIRFVNRSVEQPGDPLPRNMYHCFPRQPVGIIICGPSGIGKSDLARLLGPAAPTYSLDLYALHVLANDLTELKDIATAAYQPGRIDYIYKAMVDAGKGADFARSFMRSVQYEPVFTIEGAGLMHPPIMDEIKKILKQKGTRIAELKIPEASYYQSKARFK